MKVNTTRKVLVLFLCVVLPLAAIVLPAVIYFAQGSSDTIDGSTGLESSEIIFHNDEPVDRSTDTEWLLENEVDVTIGEFSVSHSGTGGWIVESKLDVTVVNKNPQITSYLLIIEAIDSEGNRLIDDRGYATNLRPNQKQEIEMFNLLPSDDVYKIQNAEFKIVSIEQY